MTEKRARTTVALMLAASCLLLPACASVPGKGRPALVVQAEKLNNRGVAAAGNGRFSDAEADFAESYRAYSSIEDFRGMVTVLINSSRMYRKQGKVDRASVMAETAARMSANITVMRAEAWFEMAKISLLKGDFDRALDWAEKSLGEAGNENRPALFSLLADIRLKKGEPYKGMASAEEALKLARGSDDRHEEADALRIMGDIRLSLNDPASAVAPYIDALAIDKELADPGGVYSDLQGLAAAKSGAGEPVSAMEYLLRAADVAMAAGNLSGATADLEKANLLQGGKDGPVREMIRARQDRLQSMAKGEGSQWQ